MASRPMRPMRAASIVLILVPALFVFFVLAVFGVAWRILSRAADQ